MTVNEATQVDTGKIYKVYSFGGSDFTSVTKVYHSGQFTISAWVYVTGVTPNSYRLTTADASGNIFFFGITDTDYLGVYGGIGWGNAFYSVRWFGTYSGDIYANQKDSWHRVVPTFGGSRLRIYVDGVLKNTPDIFTMLTCGSSVTVGQYLNNFWMKGTIEELNYFSNVKSGDRIATEHANQDSPSTFSGCEVESNSDETATVLIIL